MTGAPSDDAGRLRAVRPLRRRPPCPRRPSSPPTSSCSGGRIATMDAARSWASALAVRDGRIVAVGRGRRRRGARRLVDPGHRAPRPDRHAGLPGRPRPSRPRRPRPAALRAARRPRARGLPRGHRRIRRGAIPDEAWIRGGGWYMGDFPGGTPRREDLDAIVPDRPVVLTNRDGHGAWVNSRALELGGVTARHGRPRRRAHRTRRGRHARAARSTRARWTSSSGSCPDDTPADLEEALRIGQAYLHWTRDHGLAGRDRRSPKPRSGPTSPWPRAASSTARVVGAMWWEHHRGAEQIEEFVERRRATSIGRYAATSVKLMMDGVLENFTGAMLEPYGDGDGGTTDNRGLTPDRPRGLREWCPRLDALGFQPHFHAIGDRAVRESLDAVDAARRAERPVRYAAAHRPHPGHPPRRHRPLPRARRGRQRPAVLGRPRRRRWTTSRSRSSATGGAGSTRSVRCGPPARCSRWARTGASRPRTRCSRWRSRSSASPTRAVASASRSCRTSDWSSSMRWPRSPRAPRTSTTSTPRPARSRSARRPTSRSSIATCSIVAPARSARRVVGTFVEGVPVFEDPIAAVPHGHSRTDGAGRVGSARSLTHLGALARVLPTVRRRRHATREAVLMARQ